MPVIRFRRPWPEIPTAPGANLMATLLAGGLPVASSCRGDGVCAKCRVIVVDGIQNLSPVGPTEAFLKEKYDMRPEERISCQVSVNGDITVDTTYW